MPTEIFKKSQETLQETGMSEVTRKRLMQLKNRVENKDQDFKDQLDTAVNDVAEEIVDIERILDNDFVKTYITTHGVDGLKTLAHKLTGFSPQYGYQLIKQSGIAVDNTKLARLDSDFAHIFATDKGGDIMRYVVQIRRTEVLEHLVKNLVAIQGDQTASLDDTDASAILESMLSSRKVAPSNNNPSYALSRAMWLDVGLRDRRLRQQLASDMAKDTTVHTLEDIAGSGSVQVLIGSGMMDIDSSLWGTLNITHVYTHTDGKTYAMMHNGCEGNLVIIDDADSITDPDKEIPDKDNILDGEDESTPGYTAIDKIDPQQIDLTDGSDIPQRKKIASKTPDGDREVIEKIDPLDVDLMDDIDKIPTRKDIVEKKPIAVFSGGKIVEQSVDVQLLQLDNGQSLEITSYELTSDESFVSVQTVDGKRSIIQIDSGNLFSYNGHTAFDIAPSLVGNTFIVMDNTGKQLTISTDEIEKKGLTVADTEQKNKSTVLSGTVIEQEEDDDDVRGGLFGWTKRNKKEDNVVIDDDDAPKDDKKDEKKGRGIFGFLRKKDDETSSSPNKEDKKETSTSSTVTKDDEPKTEKEKRGLAALFQRNKYKKEEVDKKEEEDKEEKIDKKDKEETSTVSHTVQEEPKSDNKNHTGPFTWLSSKKKKEANNVDNTPTTTVEKEPQTSVSIQTPTTMTETYITEHGHTFDAMYRADMEAVTKIYEKKDIPQPRVVGDILADVLYEDPRWDEATKLIIQSEIAIDDIHEEQKTLQDGMDTNIAAQQKNQAAITQIGNTMENIRADVADIDAQLAEIQSHLDKKFVAGLVTNKNKWRNEKRRLQDQKDTLLQDRSTLQQKQYKLKLQNHTLEQENQWTKKRLSVYDAEVQKLQDIKSVQEQRKKQKERLITEGHLTIAALQQAIDDTQLEGISYHEVVTVVNNYITHEPLRKEMIRLLLDGNIVDAQRMYGMELLDKDVLGKYKYEGIQFYPSIIASEKLTNNALNRWKRPRMYAGKQEILTHPDIPDDVKTAYKKFEKGDLENDNKNYYILSKTDARAYLFTADHHLVATQKVILGKGRSDQPNLSYKSKDPDTWTTPAGMYKIRNIRHREINPDGKPRYSGTSHYLVMQPLDNQYQWLDEGFTLGMHPLYQPSVRRPKMDAMDPDTRRISHGCPNFYPETFDEIYGHVAMDTRVYVTAE